MVVGRQSTHLLVVSVIAMLEGAAQNPPRTLTSNWRAECCLNVGCSVRTAKPTEGSHLPPGFEVALEQLCPNQIAPPGAAPKKAGPPGRTKQPGHQEQPQQQAAQPKEPKGPAKRSKKKPVRCTFPHTHGNACSSGGFVMQGGVMEGLCCVWPIPCISTYVGCVVMLTEERTVHGECPF